MKKAQVIRAWMDEDYRAQLSPEELAQLPEHPAGLVELTDEEVSLAVGGLSANWYDGCRSIMACSYLDCTGGGAPCY